MGRVRKITSSYHRSCMYNTMNRRPWSSIFQLKHLTFWARSFFLVVEAGIFALWNVQQHPDLYLLDARSKHCSTSCPSHDSQKCLQLLPNIFWGAESLQVENNFSGDMATHFKHKQEEKNGMATRGRCHTKTINELN